jgi:C1A family cysteine protease
LRLNASEVIGELVESEEERLNAIRAAIKSKRLRWKAGSTAISRMSKEDRKNLHGSILSEDRVKEILKLQKKREREREKERKTRGSTVDPADPPTKWDWRNVSGWNWTTPIKAQGPCGSCEVFGVVGALEMLLKLYAHNDPHSNPDLSEAHLFFCNNGGCKDDDPNFGVSIDVVLDYLVANGVPDEACYPYTAVDQPCETCPDWRTRVVFGTKLKSWKYVTEINEMKTLLRTHGCLVAPRLAVFDDFYNYTGGAPYEHAWGGYEGMHCVTIVGYDDAEGCWIGKNSYGTDWGEPYPPNGGGPAGWFRIAYGECGIDIEMISIELGLPRGWRPLPNWAPIVSRQLAGTSIIETETDDG